MFQYLNTFFVFRRYIMIRNQAVSSRSKRLVKAALPPIDSESSDSENDFDTINTISKNKLGSDNA